MSNGIKCQYLSCNLDAIVGKSFCEWHAPSSDKTITQEQFENHINDKLNRGHLDFEGYVFPYPVEINGKDYSSVANFKNAQFDKSLRISNTRFSQNVIFNGAKFHGGLYLYDARFRRETSFFNSRFTGAYKHGIVGMCSIYSYKTVFEKGVKFSQNKFKFPSYFDHNTFAEEMADFYDCRFWEGVTFDNCVFQKSNLIFDLTKCKGAATTFKNSTFRNVKCSFKNSVLASKVVSFSETTFENVSDVDFTEARFIKCTADLSHINFTGKLLCFHMAEFTGDLADFSDSDISANEIRFTCVQFRSIQSTNFHNCTFNSKLIDYSSSETNSDITTFAGTVLRADEISFDGVQFADGATIFVKTEFKGSELSFDHTRFDCHFLDFGNCKFDCSSTLFEKTEFGCESVDFTKCFFLGNVSFRNNPIYASMLFCDTQLSDNCIFSFVNPRFKFLSQRIIVLLFIRVRFNSHKTFFERISPGEEFIDNTLGAYPRMAFRYCFLREAFLSENEMRIFSFFRCSYFEDAFFTSSYWPTFYDRSIFKFKRQFTIHEDVYFLASTMKSENVAAIIQMKIDNEYSYPTRYSEVSELYLRYKSSADKAKDYHLASWFYFNEIEMKRKQLAEDIQNTRSVLKRNLKRIFSKSWIYTLYKVFAGYGEKPMWSAIWLAIMISIFSIAHLFNGLAISIDRDEYYYLNYKIDLSWPIHFDVTLTDFTYSFIFTVSRIVPGSYAPGHVSKITTLTNEPFDFILSYANSFCVVILLILIAVGLKRHFRRF